MFDEEIDDLTDRIVQLETRLQTIFDRQSTKKIERADQNRITEVKNVEGRRLFQLRRFVLSERPEGKKSTSRGGKGRSIYHWDGFR